MPIDWPVLLSIAALALTVLTFTYKWGKRSARFMAQNQQIEDDISSIKEDLKEVLARLPPPPPV